MPCTLWPSIPQQNPETLDALFRNEIPQIDQLIPTQLMLSCAKDTTFLPISERKRMRNATGNEIMQDRCHKPADVVPTVMALYGQQHQISRETLEKKGYFGFFLQDHSNRLRLMHPLELALTHMIHGCHFVCADIKQSWKYIGNQITFPHAAITLVNALNQFDFVKVKLDMNEVFCDLFTNSLKMGNVSSFTGRFGMIFFDQGKSGIDWPTRLKNHDAFCEAKLDYWMPENQAWSADEGFFHIERFFMHSITEVLPENPVISQITELDQEQEEEISPTMPFQTWIKVRMIIGTHTFHFWIDDSITTSAIEQRYGYGCSVQELEEPVEGCSMILTMTGAMIISDDKEIKTAVPCLHEGGAMFVSLPRKQELKEQLAEKQLQNIQYDQFGLILDGQPFNNRWIITDFPLQHGSIRQDCVYILAAFKSVQLSFQFDASEVCSVMTIIGPHESVMILAEFWTTIFAEKSLQKLGLNIASDLSQSHARILYRSASGSFLIPHESLAECLTVMATRMILDKLSHENGHETSIKWFMKGIWTGKLDPKLNMEVVLALLQLTCWPSLQGLEVRLIHRTQQCCNIMVEELLEQSKSKTIVLHAILQMKAGAGTKEAQKIHTRNSLASSLLEMGYHIDWVSTTTEILMNNATKQAAQIVQIPPGKQRTDSIMKLLGDCAITIPEKMTKDAIHVSKFSEVSVKKKKQVIQVNPNDYSIQTGFLLNQDSSPVQQVQQVRQQGSGVILLTMEQAQPWLNESQIISKDELGLLIVGEHQIATKLESEFMHVPCKDIHGQPVILRCTIVQLGEKKIKTQTSGYQHNGENDFTTVAITFWRSDWSEEKWQQILNNPYWFVKEELKNQGVTDILEATWGKSLRNMKEPAISHHATSLQIHANLRTARLSEILSISGFNQIWVNPKTTDGRIATAWRVIWLDGTVAHLTTVAAQVQNCMGLVRNRKTMGLRFKQGDFEAAWKFIYPERAVPTPFDINFLYKIEPVPYGCTSDMLTSWANHNQWAIRPLKALGAAAWLIGAKEKAPAGILTFNGRPMLLKLLPPKSQTKTSPVVAGPKPTRSSKYQEAKSEAAPSVAMLTHDPWANYSGPKPANAQTNLPRDVTGPTEKKFQEQSERIAQVEQALATLRSDTAKGFQQVEEREKNAFAQTQQAIASVKSDLETSFQAAIAQQSSQLNSTLADLKSLLQAAPKRSRERGAEDMED